MLKRIFFAFVILATLMLLASCGGQENAAMVEPAPEPQPATEPEPVMEYSEEETPYLHFQYSLDVEDYPEEDVRYMTADHPVVKELQDRFEAFGWGSEIDYRKTNAEEFFAIIDDLYFDSNPGTPEQIEKFKEEIQAREIVWVVHEVLPLTFIEYYDAHELALTEGSYLFETEGAMLESTFSLLWTKESGKWQIKDEEKLSTDPAPGQLPE